MKKIRWKTIFLTFVLTAWFTVIIFFLNIYFTNDADLENKYIEEKYIEPTASLDAPKDNLYAVIKNARTSKTKIDTNTSKWEKIKYSYFPNSFIENKEWEFYKKTSDLFVNSRFIFDKLESLQIYIYQDTKEVRGRMKNKKIHMFWVLALPREDFLSVFIHEFWHFLDLYILKEEVSFDISNVFYNISWKSDTVLKSWVKQKDFVSGYAMTNKYEDFAESFHYYVVHNSDFLEKAKFSDATQKKYDFFNTYVFRNWEFQTAAHKTTKEVKKYYWDTTKINYNLSEFLAYLESWKK